MTPRASGAPGRLALRSMKTVTKALGLLDFFSPEEPEFGLTALARRAGLDKATTLRLLRAMKERGFIEQDPRTRRYRLGASLLRLARMRVATVPGVEAAAPILQRLAEDTGQTAHMALAAGNSLTVVLVAHGGPDPAAGARRPVTLGQKLPLHATASGIAYLAFAPKGALKEAVRPALERFTDMTPTDPDDVRRLVETARSGGVGSVDRGFAPDLVELAAPLFDGTGHARGAIAVVTPLSQTSLNTRRDQSARLIDAALACATELQVKVPATFQALATETS